MPKVPGEIFEGALAGGPTRDVSKDPDVGMAVRGLLSKAPERGGGGRDDGNGTEVQWRPGPEGLLRDFARMPDVLEGDALRRHPRGHPACGRNRAAGPPAPDATGPPTRCRRRDPLRRLVPAPWREGRGRPSRRPDPSRQHGSVHLRGHPRRFHPVLSASVSGPPGHATPTP